MRGYIAHIIGVSFQHVTKRTLADCLKLEGGSLEQYVSGGAGEGAGAGAGRGWSWGWGGHMGGTHSSGGPTCR